MAVPQVPASQPTLQLFIIAITAAAGTAAGTALRSGAGARACAAGAATQSGSVGEGQAEGGAAGTGDHARYLAAADAAAARAAADSQGRFSRVRLVCPSYPVVNACIEICSIAAVMQIQTFVNKLWGSCLHLFAPEGK